jgi:hypothetical protein
VYLAIARRNRASGESPGQKELQKRAVCPLRPADGVTLIAGAFSPMTGGE